MAKAKCERKASDKCNYGRYVGDETGCGKRKAYGRSCAHWAKDHPAQLHDAQRDAYRIKMADFRQRKRDGKVRKYERTGKHAKKKMGHTPQKVPRNPRRGK